MTLKRIVVDPALVRRFFEDECICDPSDELFDACDGEWGLMCDCGAYDRWFDSQYGTGGDRHG